MSSHKMSPSRTKKTIDISDDRLRKPNMLTTYKSNADIEDSSPSNPIELNRQAHSFVTN